MRILHISKYANTGGMETFVRDLSKEQVRQGHEVSVLCHRATPLRPGDTRQKDGVTTIRCATLCTPAFAPFAPAFPIRLRTVVKDTRPEVIHLHMPNPAVLFHAFFPEDIPLVIHWHADADGSSSRLVRALYPLYRMFEQRCLATASHVIATSPPYLDSSSSLTAWREKCTVVPLGLNPDRYPEESIATPERPLVLAVGRFTFYKGFQYLVRAAAQVNGADFVIVGGGPKKPRIEREIARLGLSGRVRLTGYVADAELCRLLQQATLFCLPSIDRGEAFGVTLLEAMRYGLPLVSTAIPGSGTGWVNQNGETGRVVPPANSDALASAIKELLEDDKKARLFGATARNRLNGEFLIKNVTKYIEDVYRLAASS